MLAMLGENDGPSMLSYATTGATYGIGFFLPFILATFVAAYIVQEMAMRLGAATGRGYGELVVQRFGRSWGWMSTIDLIATNFITLVTEVIAIRLGMGYFGVPAWGAALCAVALVASTALGGRYRRWEGIVAGLAVFNLVFLAVACLSGAPSRGILVSVASWTPFPHAGLATFFMLVASNIGATVTPWMLFFQQSASVDKGLIGPDAIKTGRINTGFGAIVAALCGAAALIAAYPLFVHHVDMSRFSDGLGFAQALRPFIGRTGGALFALGLIEAGAVAMLTVSASGAYAVGEMVQGKVASFNASLAQAPLFHAVNIGIAMLACVVVLIPGAPLMAIMLNANLLATILMPSSLILLLILVNDRAVMGRHVNGRLANVAGIGVCCAITLAALAATVTGFVNALGINL